MVIVFPTNDPSMSLVFVFLTLPQERKFQSLKFFFHCYQENADAEFSGISA